MNIHRQYRRNHITHTAVIRELFQTKIQDKLELVKPYFIDNDGSYRTLDAVKQLIRDRRDYISNNNLSGGQAEYEETQRILREAEELIAFARSSLVDITAEDATNLSYLNDDHYEVEPEHMYFVVNTIIDPDYLNRDDCFLSLYHFQLEKWSLKDVLENAVFAQDDRDNWILMHKDHVRLFAIHINGAWFNNISTRCSIIDAEQYFDFTRLTDIDPEDDRHSQLILRQYTVPQGLFWAMRAFMDEINSDWTVVNYDFYHQDHEDLLWCEWNEEYFHSDEMRYCDERDCYYHQDASVWEDIEEESRREECRGDPYFVQDYHTNMDDDMQTKEGHIEDQDTTTPGLNKFYIGFEVEKNNLEQTVYNRYDRVDIQPLFSHWETDSSCGLEGITHVYNLSNYTQFADDVDNSTYVNCDANQRCGGHINISYKSSDVNDFILDLPEVSPFCGVLYALWKPRLTNEYARYNKKLSTANQRGRYCCIQNKGNRLEFRLPSKVKNQQQLKRRFKLMQVIMSHVYSYSQHKEEYVRQMELTNARLDLKYGRQTLYKSLRADSYFNSHFFSTHLYQKMRFLLHDLTKYLDKSYKADLHRMRDVIVDSYLFQAWLDDNPNASLASVVNFIKNNQDDSDRDYLTSAQRNWCQDVIESRQVNNFNEILIANTTPCA